MKHSRVEFFRWIPGCSAPTRHGLSLLFTLFFYAYGFVLILKSGNISQIWHEGSAGERAELIVVFGGLLVIYAAGAGVSRLESIRSGARHGAFSKRFRANKMGVVGFVLLLAILCSAILAPLLSMYDPLEQPEPVLERYMPPSLGHPMGTDKFGRDILSRVLYGARVSLSIGVIAVILAALLGTGIGAVSGYVGGWIDGLSMRVVDGLLAFPRLLIVLTLVALFSNSFTLIIAVIAATAWMGIARLVRTEVQSLKQTKFIEAARAAGLGRVRIIYKHLIPNSLGPVIVAATLRIGGVILLESSLSFLGLGIQPPAPSWGAMVFEGREVLLSAWWVAAFPAIAIVAAVIACNLLGDGLRDAMDVRTPV
ncbi:MAG: ABC transporter permease subunit [Candidatus Latescibacteria bacterium]|nr:ABC transporter permease subunit [Candidatus Latescibacterota bacterium]NIO27310.1 ABC transporter permease subunit [Candidatus Latescibacterota bacterium]NIO54834.1 ABC transporter permease subunit [Candidatus Latescibacterota bacterium]NIT00917.1 ABC transporter permease subunit [Candidatus Latescibacterota bacterium]NIT37840.1 ABC transporter permease subunit [Candidatus Latescibacterota bacterium]